MLNEHRLKFRQFVDDLTGYVAELGVRLEYGRDFRSFCQIPTRQPLRHPVNPAFDPDHCGFEESNGFWIIGCDPSGEIVHTQAIKLLELQDKTFGEYLDQRLWDFRSQGYTFDRERSCWHLTPQARDISGVVTYHGELWLKGGPHGFRGGSLVVLLTRLMLLKAYLEFRPDYYVGLQSPISSSRGLGVREGYMRAEQRTICWAYEGSEKFAEDWLVWMSREEAEFNLRIPPQFFLELFEPPAEKILLKKSA